MTSISYRPVTLVLVLGLLACTGCADDSGENAESQSSDVKKKVKPTGGYGALELVGPSFLATGFDLPTFTFDRLAVKPGERIQRPPGHYPLRSSGPDFVDGRRLENSLWITIARGEVVRAALSGLRIRFAEPVTLGSARVSFQALDGAGVLKGDGPWATSPTGASMLVMTGDEIVRVTSNAQSVHDARAFEGVLASGQLTEVVLPTARVAVLLDAYDPAYPTPTSSCEAPTVRGGASAEWGGAGHPATTFVRNADGSSNAEWVVPQGGEAPVTLNAYGLKISQATVAGTIHTFTLNRLEVDDIEVAQLDGGTTRAAGSFTVSRRNADGSFTALGPPGYPCGFPTHSGIDLPDGTYRVTTRHGQFTSTEDVSFP